MIHHILPKQTATTARICCGTTVHEELLASFVMFLQAISQEVLSVVQLARFIDA